MKIAVVRNHAKTDRVISRFGQVCPERYGRSSVNMVLDSLRQAGHVVEVFNADTTLLGRLERFMPPDPATGMPTGLVMNMSYGIQGECRYAHLPAMLEMAGIPYTGSGPLGHAVALDKVIAKILMLHAGVPTPPFQVMGGPETEADGLRFPLVVKPRHESTSFGLRLARDPRELAEAVQTMTAKYRQEALVEEYIDGREVLAPLLGNDPVECLPLVELDFDERELRMVTYDDKYHKAVDEPGKICPATVSDAQAARLRELARATFRACQCKDYARVDMRIDEAGNPSVLEINSMASLSVNGSYMLSARTAGYTPASLICRIVDVIIDLPDC